MTLALFDAQEMAGALDEPSPSGDGRDGVCVVLRVTAVDEPVSSLREDGVELVAKPADHPEWGLRTGQARDPDGTLIEVNEPL